MRSLIVLYNRDITIETKTGLRRIADNLIKRRIAFDHRRVKTKGWYTHIHVRTIIAMLLMLSRQPRKIGSFSAPLGFRMPLRNTEYAVLRIHI